MDASKLVEERIEIACMAQGPYGKEWKSTQNPTLKNSEGMITRFVTLA